MFTRLRKARRLTPAEMQITAFMNLMVVLVPFLLITAVFTQISIQELDLPDTQAAAPEQREQQLTVVIRSAGLEVYDARGPLQRFPKNGADYDLKALGELLAGVKQRLPQENRITLLLEPQIPYDALIQVMDTVRYNPQPQPGGSRDMFPLVSIGDAAPAPEASP